MKLISRSLAAGLLAMSNLLAGPMDPIKPDDYKAPVRVSCIGDSITEGSGAAPGKAYPSQLQELLGDKWKVTNFGISGRTLLKNGDFPYWKEEKYQFALKSEPDVVIIMLGTNDTKPQNWKFEKEFVADYTELVKSFQALPSKPRIYVCRPCPVPEPGNFGINEKNLKEWIKRIDKLAKEMDLGVIDMHAALKRHPEMLPDRVHPDTAGAGEMAKAAFEVLTGDKAPKR
ncbi:GDSL-type esterase/lipase family protein [Luteolibacter sp. GHJ8]|uniref:GDSL-type esterase/lipase family protein n=1 Tax=Luteolibacter rhizosphaerae TaxID=2989719 RepID=A0ABT3G4A7_9BACT|nr:GDSL-type esterase/lipase family protein [Luteolibacter rhizosphaerae]MCW1914324.1 GDSL-type esterase/lipase family protein [Luteolibacter rhizosphaerae]